MKEIKSTICKCGSKEYKVLSKEKYCKVIKCLSCGKEFTLVTDANKTEIRGKVEKEIESGELDSKFKKD